MPPGKNPLAQLADFLASKFSMTEIDDLVLRFSPAEKDLTQQVGNDNLKKKAFDAVQVLHKHRLIGPDFFSHLNNERPNSEAEIDVLAAAFKKYYAPPVAIQPDEHAQSDRPTTPATQQTPTTQQSPTSMPTPDEPAPAPQSGPAPSSLSGVYLGNEDLSTQESETPKSDNDLPSGIDYEATVAHVQLAEAITAASLFHFSQGCAELRMHLQRLSSLKLVVHGASLTLIQRSGAQADLLTAIELMAKYTCLDVGIARYHCRVWITPVLQTEVVGKAAIVARILAQSACKVRKDNKKELVRIVVIHDWACNIRDELESRKYTAMGDKWKLPNKGHASESTWMLETVPDPIKEGREGTQPPDEGSTPNGLAISVRLSTGAGDRQSITHDAYTSSFNGLLDIAHEHIPALPMVCQWPSPKTEGLPSVSDFLAVNYTAEGFEIMVTEVNSIQENTLHPLGDWLITVWTEFIARNLNVHIGVAYGSLYRVENADKGATAVRWLYHGQLVDEARELAKGSEFACLNELAWKKLFPKEYKGGGVAKTSVKEWRDERDATFRMAAGNTIFNQLFGKDTGAYGVIGFRANAIALTRRSSPAFRVLSAPYQAEVGDSLTIAQKDGTWHAVVECLITLSLVLCWMGPTLSPEVLKFVYSPSIIILSVAIIWLSGLIWGIWCEIIYGEIMACRILPTMRRYQFASEWQETLERSSILLRAALARPTRLQRFNATRKLLGLFRTAFWAKTIWYDPQPSDLIWRLPKAKWRPPEARPDTSQNVHAVRARDRLRIETHGVALLVGLLGTLSYGIGTAVLLFIWSSILQVQTIGHFDPGGVLELMRSKLAPETGIKVALGCGFVWNVLFVLRIARVDWSVLSLRYSELLHTLRAFPHARMFDLLAAAVRTGFTALLFWKSLEFTASQPVDKAPHWWVVPLAGVATLSAGSWWTTHRTYFKFTDWCRRALQDFVEPEPRSNDTEPNLAPRPTEQLHPNFAALRVVANEARLLAEAGKHIADGPMAHKAAEARAEVAWIVAGQHGIIHSISGPMADRLGWSRRKHRQRVSSLYVGGDWAAMCVGMLARHAPHDKVLEMVVYVNDKRNEGKKVPCRLFVRMIGSDIASSGYLGLLIPVNSVALEAAATPGGGEHVHRNGP